MKTGGTPDTITRQPIENHCIRLSIGVNYTFFDSIMTAYLAHSIHTCILCIVVHFGSPVKLVYNDHSRDPKIVAVVGTWSLFVVSTLIVTVS